MTNQCTTIIHPLVVLPRPCWRCAVTLSPSPPQPRLAAAASVQSLAGPRAGLVTGHQHTRPAQPRHPSLHQRGGRARGEGVAGAGGGEEQGGAGGGAGGGDGDGDWLY